MFRRAHQIEIVDAEQPGSGVSGEPERVMPVAKPPSPSVLAGAKSSGNLDAP